MTGPDSCAMTGSAPAATGADALLVAFARAVRAAGVAVTADRERGYLSAVAALGIEDPWAVLVAGRATLCASPQDIARHDQVYEAWFGGESARLMRPPPAHTRPYAEVDQEPSDGRGEGRDEDVVSALASAVEVLKQRDIATLSGREKEALARLFAAIPVKPPMRTSPRRHPARRGRIDPGATLREQVRRMGEPGPVRFRHRSVRPRRVIVLIDVSGSMSAYADAFLRLAHRFVQAGGPVEVFTIGTRLTHITRALTLRDPDRALIAAGQVVPDWSGGTRLGEGLAAFLSGWGRRGPVRGAVAVIISDGWERDQPEALGEQVRRIRALAHRVVWVNPHRGKTGYAPVQQGMAAALPFIDDFVAGHTLATFHELSEVIDRA